MKLMLLYAQQRRPNIVEDYLGFISININTTLVAVTTNSSCLSKLKAYIFGYIMKNHVKELYIYISVFFPTTYPVLNCKIFKILEGPLQFETSHISHCLFKSIKSFKYLFHVLFKSAKWWYRIGKGLKMNIFKHLKSFQPDILFQLNVSIGGQTHVKIWSLK